METIEIKKENVEEAFKQAGDNKELQSVLYALFGKPAKTEQPKNVMERIKTVDDAMYELGSDHQFVKEWISISENPVSSDLAAYMQLRIVCAALNEGGQPTFTEDEWRYYPWFYLYTQDEINQKTNYWKQNRHLTGTGDYITDYAGFASALSSGAPSTTSATIGSRLCLKNSELASYCGKQFINLWADFNLIRKGIL